MLITLHAVAHALGELELLDPGERALAIDRADILIRREADALHRLWRPKPLPCEVGAFIDEARSALDRAAPAPVCFEWFVESERAVFEHPGALLIELGAAGVLADVYLPSPGVDLFRGSIAAAVCTGEAEPDADLALELVGGFLEIGEGEVSGPRRSSALRQVYRQYDFGKGGPVRDLIAPVGGGAVPGQPLLIAGLVGGEIRPVPMSPRRGVPLEPIPVEVWESDAPESGSGA